MSTSSSNSNVDANEINKFEALAARWWDPESEFKPLHEINPLRLDYINRRSKLDNKKVIDVGCGGGILTESMAAAGAQVTGIDMGEAPLAVARLHQHETNVKINYQKSTAENFAAQKPESFDVVTCMEMLEHVPQPASVIEACARLVKPGGHIFFSTLNRNPKSFLFAIVGAEYVLNLLPKGTHEYQKFIKPSELSNWARQAKLNVREITGMSYNPFSKKYSLGYDVGVNYLVHCQKDSQV
ncbi:3-demethylubiquinol 3-O-methyltransferase @ 2-polyprenyl-6-hydroxyphenyl methylase [hydrothermal vent metagenome]|uniref:3-demethylubiquinol 3-O-methyltransferase @ 2-polyprenyl-6-hydroxyphenyl methylase n=1 Tax=hydrothermal vent metagenome TaxID=652676 RepID=A0A3B0ZU48_9ZZZZ